MVENFLPAKNKPGRSDEIVEEDEQKRVTDQIKAQFESMAPKRPIKPNRSESDHLHSSAEAEQFSTLQDSIDIPELDKLRSLQSQSSGLLILAEERDHRSNIVDDQEYVETQYYKELDSIEKQHHTTGSGFIKVERGGGENNGYGLLEVGNGFDHDHDHGRKVLYSAGKIRSNPATNDWVPDDVDDDDHQMILFKSSKPNRSENS